MAKYSSSKMPKGTKGKYKATATTTSGRTLYQYGATPSEAEQNLDEYIKQTAHAQNRIAHKHKAKKV